MGRIRMKKTIVIMAASLLLAACGAEGTYYEKSPASVAAAITDAELSPMLAGEASDSTVSKPNSDTVVITGNDAFGGDIFKITATLTPEGNGTRVQTQFALLHKKKGYDEYMAQKMAQEHVAAAIEGRSVDIMAAANPVAKAMINSNPEMSKAVNQGMQAAIAFEKMEKQAEFEEEYGSDWGSSLQDADDGWGE